MLVTATGSVSRPCLYPARSCIPCIDQLWFMTELSTSKVGHTVVVAIGQSGLRCRPTGKFAMLDVHIGVCLSPFSVVTYGMRARLRTSPLSTTTLGACGRSTSLSMQRDGSNSVFVLGTVSCCIASWMLCPTDWYTASNNTEPTFVRSAWK
jgi:hypothetical protein